MYSATDKPTVSCLDCRGRCCRSHYVWVTGYDIWRISTAQWLAPESFVVLGQHGDEPSPHGFYLDSTERPYYLTLDKKGTFTRFQPCIFLVELANGDGKCGVYPSRPAVCRAYPLSLMNGQVRVTQSASCPPGSLPQIDFDQPALHSAPRRAYLELDLYAQVVARWNSRIAYSPGEAFTLNEYFGYLMNVFQSLALLEAGMGDAQMRGVEESWPTPPRVIMLFDDFHAPPQIYPWLDFLLQATDIICSFYPTVPRTPISVSISGVSEPVLEQ